DFNYRVLPFDEILDELQLGRAQAGLLIHEGQLTYASLGLQKSVDLGEWWLLETGLPLPLGVNVARRDLGEERLHDLSEVLRASTSSLRDGLVAIYIRPSRVSRSHPLRSAHARGTLRRGALARPSRRPRCSGHRRRGRARPRRSDGDRGRLLWLRQPGRRGQS